MDLTQILIIVVVVIAVLAIVYYYKRKSGQSAPMIQEKTAEPYSEMQEEEGSE